MENITNTLSTHSIDDPFTDNLTTNRRVSHERQITAKPTQPARNIVEQAVGLFEPSSGWAYLPSEIEGLFVVRNELTEAAYTVFLGSERSKPYCSCSQWKQTYTCVHMLAIQYEQDWLADVVAREQIINDAEHPEFGSDPYMHYDRGY